MIILVTSLEYNMKDTLNLMLPQTKSFDFALILPLGRKKSNKIQQLDANFCVLLLALVL